MPMLTTSVKRPPAPADGARADALREVRHAGENGVDLGHHVLAVDHHGRIRAVAQRGVQDRPALGHVDRLAGEHRVAPCGHAGGLGELDQQRQRMGVEVGLGEVEQHVAETGGELAEPVRVALEQRDDAPVLRRGAGLGQLRPDRVGLHRHPRFNWLAFTRERLDLVPFALAASSPGSRPTSRRRRARSAASGSRARSAASRRRSGSSSSAAAGRRTP